MTATATEKLKSFQTLVKEMSTANELFMARCREIAEKKFGWNVVRPRGRHLSMGDSMGAFAGKDKKDWDVTKKSLREYIEEAKAAGATWVEVYCVYQAKPFLAAKEKKVLAGEDWSIQIWNAEEGFKF